MHLNILHIWDRVRSSYWFLPALMLLGGAVLSNVAVWLDAAVVRRGIEIPFGFRGSAGGARTVLSSIATSVITVAGVVFSITIASLTLASQQFGPRLLRNFMRDTANQLVIGTFTATFLYCLLVMGSVDSRETGAVPQLAVTLGITLAVLALVVLIYFIHHVSQSIQAPLLVAAVARDLLSRIESEALRDTASLPCGQPLPENFDEKTHLESTRSLTADRAGYLQVVDEGALLGDAHRHDLVISVNHQAGDFVAGGEPLAAIAPASALDPKLESALRSRFIVGRERTDEQDIEFMVNQLVEIAVRALSPGINDPFTAIQCIEWLGAALSMRARATPVGRCGHDPEGALRVLCCRSDFAGFADAALCQIRQHSADHPAVVLRAIEVLTDALHLAPEGERRETLRQHAALFANVGRENFAEGYDLVALEERCERAGL